MKRNPKAERICYNCRKKYIQTKRGLKLCDKYAENCNKYNPDCWVCDFTNKIPRK